jgi:hypothetical protein
MKLYLIFSTTLLLVAQTGRAAIVCGGWDAQNIPKIFKVTEISRLENGGFISVRLEKTNPFKLKESMSGDGVSKTPFLGCEKGVLSGIANGRRIRNLKNDLLITCVGPANGLQIILYKTDSRNYSGKLFSSSKIGSTGSYASPDLILNCSVN